MEQRKLDEFEEMVEQMAESAPEESGWTIEDDEAADWALRRIREVTDECERLNETRRRIVETYKNAIRAEEERAERKISNLRWHLRNYFERVPHKATKTQESYRLPSGTLLLKRPPVQFEREDEAVMDWLQREGLWEYIESKRTLRWGELKKGTGVAADGGVYWMDTGEMIPGLRAVARDPEFTVK